MKIKKLWEKLLSFIFRFSHHDKPKKVKVERVKVPHIKIVKPVDPDKEWIEGHKEALRTWNYHINPSRISYIFIHHSLSEDNETRNWDAIRRYHMSWRYKGEIIDDEQAQYLINNGHHVEKPWSDIGYHFGIELDGDDYQIYEGRNLDKRGAHIVEGGLNNDSIGICDVGNFDKIVPPRRQWLLTIELVKSLRDFYKRFGIVVPVKNVMGHGEGQKMVNAGYSKSCPGKKFNMKKFRDNLV